MGGWYSHIHLVCNIGGLRDDARLVSHGLSNIFLFRLNLLDVRQHVRIANHSMVNT